MSLGEVFGNYADERTDWGKADVDTRHELSRELWRTTATLDDACRANKGGLLLAAPPPGVDVDEELRSTAPRGKSKRPGIDPELVAQLQSAYACGQRVNRSNMSASLIVVATRSHARIRYFPVRSVA